MRQLQKLNPHVHIQGRVEHGFGRGSQSLGYPTANLNSSTSQSLHDFLSSMGCFDGVYIGWGAIPGVHHPRTVAVSVGTNPTFEDSKVRLLEAHFIDYDGPAFYGEMIRISLCAYIRPAIKFHTLSELTTEIFNDCQFAKEWLQKDSETRNEQFSKFLNWDDS